MNVLHVIGGKIRVQHSLLQTLVLIPNKNAYNAIQALNKKTTSNVSAMSGTNSMQKHKSATHVILSATSTLFQTMRRVAKSVL